MIRKTRVWVKSFRCMMKNMNMAYINISGNIHLAVMPEKCKLQLNGRRYLKNKAACCYFALPMWQKLGLWQDYTAGKAEEHW